MTRSELQLWLDQEKVAGSAYDLDGRSIEYTYTLRHLSDDRWAVFYTERSQEMNYRVFESEHLACVEILYDLLRDHTACVAAKQ